MKINSLIAVLTCAVFSAVNVSAQADKSDLPVPKPTGTFVVNQTQQVPEVSRERRSQAYAKMLEAQRYIWTVNRLRQQGTVDVASTQAAIVANSKLAKQALQKAVELNPNLSEGYTTLANLSKNMPPYDIDDSILLAEIAVKIDRNNFGAHQILAQLYTFKSQLNRGALDSNFTRKAIAEWNEITRLDARNAEAFAFLNEFYAKTNKRSEQIAALRNWLASSTPLSDGFYGRVFQGESLAPQAATVKLGQALFADKQTREAVEILSRAVAEEPENTEAIKLLASAIESADNASVSSAVQSLQQAVFANPDNPSLFLLLAQVQSRTGKVDDAVKVLRDASGKFAGKDKIVSADLQVALADIYGDTNRVDEAAAVYQNALTIRGIDKTKAITNEERNFAVLVFEKIIVLYQKANRPNDAKAAIERARILLGSKDLFADKQIVSS